MNVEMIKIGIRSRKATRYNRAAAPGLAPLTTVYVFINTNLSFADRGTVLRIPAFKLAYLLRMEERAIMSDAFKTVVAAATIARTGARFAAANIWNRIIIGYSTINALDIILNIDYRRYIEDNFDGGGYFVEILERVDAVLALRSSAMGIISLTPNQTQLIQALFSQWDIIYLEIDARQTARSRNIREAMINLQSSLDTDETIF